MHSRMNDYVLYPSSYHEQCQVTNSMEILKDNEISDKFCIGEELFQRNKSINQVNH